MLFNSYEFIFLFFPIVFSGFFLLSFFDKKISSFFLASSSFFFYGCWNPIYLLLLFSSIIFNYTCGYLITKQNKIKKTILLFSLSINLICLFYFKYYNFFLENISYLTVNNYYQIHKITLPLGISFFTFTQIAFLVDCYKGLVKEKNFIHYCLFITYFPHLIAGPILHHKQMMPQFQKDASYCLNYDNIAMGLIIFIIGLSKKIIFADNLSLYCSPIFDASLNENITISFIESLVAILSYSFQLYFDFSGYSDMAVGISLFFNIKLPINFNSPYKSSNIIEFWRRWHISLSSFLKDYIYIPLGGNRKGNVIRYINLFLTMLFGGIWHGSGWTFIVWGALHGVFLILNHLWVTIKSNYFSQVSSQFGKFFSHFITLFCVMIGWVFFRAENIASAMKILKGLCSFDNVRLPSLNIFQNNIFFDENFSFFLRPMKNVHILSEFYIIDFMFILSFLFISLLFPNSMEISSYFLKLIKKEKKIVMIVPILLSIILFYFLITVNRVSEFLYFQF